MSTDSELLQSALATVNTLGQTLQNALDGLVEHNTDIEAHDDIRAILKKLMNSDQIFTNDQITEIITNALRAHKETSFKEAHVGWEEYTAELDSRLTDITTRIDELTTRLDNYVNGSEGSGGPPSSLKDLVDAINAKYNPQITELTNMIAKAQNDGDDALVETYQTSLRVTLEARNQEIIQATSDWVSSQSGAP